MINPNYHIDFALLEKEWHANAQINNDYSKIANRKILKKLIKNPYCSNEQLLNFMNKVGVGNRGWFNHQTKSPVLSFISTLFSQSSPEPKPEKELVKIFKDYRGFDVSTFFENKIENAFKTKLDLCEVLNDMENNTKKDLEIETKKNLIEINNRDFFDSLKIQKQQYQEFKGLFTQLAEVHRDVQKTLDGGYGSHSDAMTANIFGDPLFYKKKYYSDRPVEGHWPPHAIWTYLEGLKSYYNSIKESLSSQDHEKFKELFEAYHTFYISGLIHFKMMQIDKLCCEKIISKDNEKEMLTQWAKFATQMLMQDISDVNCGKKNRGYWNVGFDKHFMSLRYEKLEDGRFVLGVFNLGGGSEANIVNIMLKQKIAAEIRIDPAVIGLSSANLPTGSPQEILAASSVLDEVKLKNFCENIIRIISSPQSEWVTFINSVKMNPQPIDVNDVRKPINVDTQNVIEVKLPIEFPKSTDVPSKERKKISIQDLRNRPRICARPDYRPQIERKPTYLLNQRVQLIGNCTCKGQSALLKKEFYRLFANHLFVSYSEFKKLFQGERLSKLQPQHPVWISLDPKAYQEENTLNKDQVYQICWRHYHRLSDKDLMKMKEEAIHLSQEEKWKAICVKFSIENNSMKHNTFSLESLFGDNNTVIIGKEPSLIDFTPSPEVSYYCVPNVKECETFSQIGLTLIKNVEGEIIVTVNQESVPTIVKKADGNHVVYNTGDHFVLTPDMHSIVINGFIMDLSFLG